MSALHSCNQRLIRNKTRSSKVDFVGKEKMSNQIVQLKTNSKLITWKEVGDHALINQKPSRKKKKIKVGENKELSRQLLV